MFKCDPLFVLLESSFDKIYQCAMDGYMKFNSAKMIATYYQSQRENPCKAIDLMIKKESLKVGASGFITNLGGLLTLPISLPVNTFALLLFQFRLILAIAIIYKVDISEPKMKPYFYLLICGQSGGQLVQEYLKRYFMNRAQSFTYMASRKICKAIIMQHGIKNISKCFKMLPFMGGIVAGAIDGGFTYKMAYFANKELYKVIH